MDSPLERNASKELRSFALQILDTKYNPNPEDDEPDYLIRERLNTKSRFHMTEENFHSTSLREKLTLVKEYLVKTARISPYVKASNMVLEAQRTEDGMSSYLLVNRIKDGRKMPIFAFEKIETSEDV